MSSSRIEEIMRRHQDGPFGACETCDVLAELARVTGERDALVEDNTALRWQNGDSYDTFPPSRLREPEYFKVGDRELEKTAVCRCCDQSWAWSYVSPDGHCLHCVDGRAGLLAELARVEAERDAAIARAEAMTSAFSEAQSLIHHTRHGGFMEDCDRMTCVVGRRLIRAALAAAAPGEGEWATVPCMYCGVVMPDMVSLNDGRRVCRECAIVQSDCRRTGGQERSDD